jgi:hypothetical protein
MGEEVSRACEMAAQEEDGMDGDEDDSVRMQSQPAATTSTGAVPSDESSKGPMSAGPALNQNVFSQQQQCVQQQQQQVLSVPQMNFARASNSANSFDMPTHPGLASGKQATYEPSGHQHGVSRASLAHSDSQTRRSRALLDTRPSWALLVGPELGGTSRRGWDCMANSSNSKSRRHRLNHSGDRALEVDRVRLLQFLLMPPEVRWMESRSSCSDSSSTVFLTNNRRSRWTKTRTA